VPEDIFRAWIDEKMASDGFSRNAIRKLAQRYVTAKKREARKALTISKEGCHVYVGDIREVSALRTGIPAAAIITDPPYEASALPLWGDLVRFAARPGILAEHGWILAMSGQRWLPQVFEQVTTAARGTGIRYVWTMAIHTPGGQSSTAWIGERNPLCSEWKPLLILSKGSPSSWPGVNDWTSDTKDLPPGLRDFLVSQANDKRYHDWGQSVNVFERLVESFAPVGGLVVDPFLGGGTTGLAARKHGRAFEGFDIDADHVTTAAGRLA
jgi:hypothetical protein